MLTLTLNYRDPRMALCLNLSFEFINLFKRINVDVNTEKGILTLHGEQEDIKTLLENLYKHFNTDNGLINMLMFMYINATNDISVNFNNTKDINKIITEAKKYNVKCRIYNIYFLTCNFHFQTKYNYI